MKILSHVKLLIGLPTDPLKHLIIFMQDGVGVINFYDKVNRLQGNWLLSSSMKSRKFKELCGRKEVSFLDMQVVADISVLMKSIENLKLL